MISKKCPGQFFYSIFMPQFLKKFHAIKIFLKILGFFSRKSLFLLNKCWQVANRPQNCQPATPATAKFCRPHKPQNRPRWPNSATSGHTAFVFVSCISVAKIVIVETAKFFPILRKPASFSDWYILAGGSKNRQVGYNLPVLAILRRF